MDRLTNTVLSVFLGVLVGVILSAPFLIPVVVR